MPHDNLLNHVKQFNLPFTINDSVKPFAITDSARFDTLTLEQFDLTEYLKQGSQYLPKTSKGFDCSPIGYYNYGNFTILLYEGITTEAGDGNPVAIMLTLNRYHKIIDHRVILFEQASADYSQLQVDYITATADGALTVKTRKIERGFMKDSLVVKRVSTQRTIYTISFKGNINEEI